MVFVPPASVLSFYSGEIAFCIPCPLVKEVLPIPKLTVPPGCPEILEGLLLSDKTSRPVMDLARLFDRMASPVGKFTPLLVLDASVTPLVLKVDRVCSIIDCRALERVEVDAADSFNGACCGIYELNGERLHLLDLDRLLTQREARLLDDFTRQSHARFNALEASA